MYYYFFIAGAVLIHWFGNNYQCVVTQIYNKLFGEEDASEKRCDAASCAHASHP